MQTRRNGANSIRYRSGVYRDTCSTGLIKPPFSARLIQPNDRKDQSHEEKQTIAQVWWLPSPGWVVFALIKGDLSIIVQGDASSAILSHNSTRRDDLVFTDTNTQTDIYLYLSNVSESVIRRANGLVNHAVTDQCNIAIRWRAAWVIRLNRQIDYS